MSDHAHDGDRACEGCGATIGADAVWDRCFPCFDREDESVFPSPRPWPTSSKVILLTIAVAIAIGSFVA